MELNLDEDCWHECSRDWESPFKPVETGWESYLKLDDIFPWQHTGVTSNRNWVWAPDANTLRKRWTTIVRSDKRNKARLFKETRDRKIDKTYPSIKGIPSYDYPIIEEFNEDPNIVPVAFRSFNRQYLILDRRVVDFPRPELWYTYGRSQVYLSEPPGYSYRTGPGVAFSALVPNVDHFMGHHGGRVIPLYRDPNGVHPNISSQLLEKLSQFIGVKIAAEDMLAYVAAIVAHSGYTLRFHDRLTTPGIHVPVTMDKQLWKNAVNIGREVIWIHTFGDRYVDESDDRPHEVPRLAASDSPQYVQPISDAEEFMPDQITYNVNSRTITIGEQSLFGLPGQISNVSQSVFDYTVGGTRVIRKWFDYRKKNPDAKKRTSPLDSINPIRWTAEFDDELLNLLNVLGRCVALESKQAKLLERVCSGPLVTVSDLNREGALPNPDYMGKPPRIPNMDPLIGLNEIGEQE